MNKIIRPVQRKNLEELFKKPVPIIKLQSLPENKVTHYNSSPYFRVKTVGDIDRHMKKKIDGFPTKFSILLFI